MRLIAVIACLVLAAVLAGCGGEERADNAVEAQEGNTVELDGISYRAVLFRELNPNLAPDKTLVQGPGPGEDKGFYGLFVTACNTTDAPRRASSELHIEDAFGTVFEPLPASTSDPYEYRGQVVPPGRCLPGEGSAANRLVDGAALVFAVPFDKLSNRPFIFEVEAGQQRRRLQLDL